MDECVFLPNSYVISILIPRMTRFGIHEMHMRIAQEPAYVSWVLTTILAICGSRVQQTSVEIRVRECVLIHMIKHIQ
jgi:hypothetical protein